MNDDHHSESSSELEKLYGSYLDRVEAGEAMDLESFVQDHPQHASGLRELHEGLIELRALGLPDSKLPSSLPAEMPLLGEGTRVVDVLDHLKSLRPAEGRYVVGEKIAEGGMGCILATRDIILHRDLAMKVLRGQFLGNERALARLLDEAQVTGQLEHPAIVPVHDLGVTEEDELFFLMKLVEGEDLSDVFGRVTRGDRRELLRTLTLLLRVCEAVAYAHERGVLHRDLKPSNIRVGSFGEVYVMDWGLARVRELVQEGAGLDTDRTTLEEGDSPFQTLDGDALGTPCYMSREQAKGNLDDMDARSDVYSMGAILYELLAGRAPHVRAWEQPGDIGSGELLVRAMNESPEALHSIALDAPPELISICEKAMAVERADRYQDIASFRQDLANFVEDRAVQAHETGALVELRKWVRRNRGMAGTIVGALLIVLVTAGFTIAVIQNSNEEKDVVIGQRDEALDMEKDANRKTERALAGETVAKLEAQDSARQSKKSLAQELLSSGESQASRGRQRAALAFYDRAAANDLDGQLEVEIQLARSDAQFALYDRDAALEILQSLKARANLGAQQSTVDLRLGAISLIGWGDAEDASGRGEELVRAALQSGLAPADEVFAKALLATKTADTQRYLEEALQLNSFHYLASNVLLSVYYLGGQVGKTVALAEVLSKMFPEDPTIKVCLVLCHLRAFEFEAATAQTNLLEGTLPKKALKKLYKSIQLAERYRVEPHLGNLFGCSHSLLPESAARLQRAVDFVSLFEHKQFRNVMPQTPSTRAAMEKLLAGMRSVVMGENAEALAQLEQAFEVHQDALIPFTIAQLHLALMPNVGLKGYREPLEKIVANCKLAEPLPTIIPAVLDAATILRVRCEVNLAMLEYLQKGETGELKAMLESVRQLDRLESAGDCTFAVFHRELRGESIADELRYELSSVWMRRCPESEKAALTFIQDARSLSVPAEALVTLDSLRKRLGDRADLMAIREKLLSELARSDAAGGEAGGILATPIEAGKGTE